MMKPKSGRSLRRNAPLIAGVGLLSLGLSFAVPAANAAKPAPAGGGVQVAYNADCTAVSVTSAKDLSNVIWRLADGSEVKVDGMSGHSYVIPASTVVGVWVKAGNNKAAAGAPRPVTYNSNGVGEYHALSCTPVAPVADTTSTTEDTTPTTVEDTTPTSIEDTTPTSIEEELPEPSPVTAQLECEAAAAAGIPVRWDAVASKCVAWG